MKHEYRGKKSHDEGFCDDAYCTGHSSQVVRCSCGWHESTYSSWDDEWKSHFQWLQHVVEELQK